jgi:large subunit ribosomal protein L9
MKVILLKDVNGLGKADQVVETKDGYAKNFLFKNKLAVAYTETAKKILETVIDEKEAIELANIREANALKVKIEALQLQFHLRSKSGNPFGVVSNKAIIDELATHGIKVTKYMFDEKNPKQYDLGIHEVKINLSKKVSAILSINVKAKND